MNGNAAKYADEYVYGDRKKIAGERRSHKKRSSMDTRLVADTDYERRGAGM
jgi:hypothetical protein